MRVHVHLNERTALEVRTGHRFRQSVATAVVKAAIEAGEQCRRTSIFGGRV